MLLKLLSLVALALAIYFAYFLSAKPDYPVPKIPSTGYFGPGKPPRLEEVQGAEKKGSPVDKFVIKVEDNVLDDLKAQLQRYLRRPRFEAIDDVRFWDGFHPNVMEKVVDHWLNVYDWRQHEAFLNHYAHFRTQIEGLNIHFIHMQPTGKYKRVFPILMLHGWPGGVWEFFKVIPLLTNPTRFGFNFGKGNDDIAFEVIAPSLPGFGWSDAAHKRGLSYIAAARIMAKLMDRLQFKSYYLQGGDWGSQVVTAMAALYPNRIRGLHLNMAIAYPTEYPNLMVKYILASYMPSLIVDKEDMPMFRPLKSFLGDMMAETGYYHMHATKPNTLGSSLHDSPIGLAAWILEKYSTATDMNNRNRTDGGLTDHFTMDELLTNVMVYWVTNTGPTAIRFYKESITDPYNREMQRATIHVPTAFAQFRYEPLNFPKSFIEHRYRNIRRFTRIPEGGHFAAMQKPKELAKDVFLFVEDMEEE